MTTIPEFFEGKIIFITGGTGFLGKVLIEKLLWTCPGIKTIYLLLRPKKGIKSTDRLAQLEKNMLFDRVRNRDPQTFQRIVKAVDGDITELNLGLSVEHRKILIETVSIVYHSAASVRFDNPLKTATIINIRGTRDVILLAKEMKALQIVLYVSTAFSNLSETMIEEILYPPVGDWQSTIKLAENIDEQIINAFTAKYIGEYPNTYGFTKNLAEHVVNDLRGNIPTVIYRPSIVMPCRVEPLPGWIDNTNGPTGVFIAAGKGILRVMDIPRDNEYDFIPVDDTVKGMILATWKYAFLEKKQPSISLINCAIGSVQHFTNSTLLEKGVKASSEIPLNNILWLPGLHYANIRIIYFIKFLLYNLLPALVIDSILILCRYKPIMMKVNRMINTRIGATIYYLRRPFHFQNDNFLELRKLLNPKDAKDFYYDLENMDIDELGKILLLGVRRYVLNEPDETLPQAKIHYKRIYYLAKTVQMVFWLLLAWYISKLFLALI